MYCLISSVEYCVYGGAQYNQGQTWADGCFLNCRCDDASRGVYTCSERYVCCKTYHLTHQKSDWATPDILTFSNNLIE